MAHFVDAFWGEYAPIVYVGNGSWATNWGAPMIGVWGPVTGMKVVVRNRGIELQSSGPKVNNIIKYLLPPKLKDGDILDANVGGSTWATTTVRLVDDNATVLRSGSSEYVYPYNDGIAPLAKVGVGGRHYGYLMMQQVHGLAIHITASTNTKESMEKGYVSGMAADFDNRKVNAHFLITRGGHVYQFIALCFQSTAQQEGNPFWISVELEGTPDFQGEKAPMTPIQLIRCRELFGRLAGKYGFAPTLARPYIGSECKVTSPALVSKYKMIGTELATRYGIIGSTNRNDCVMSEGLTCHYWIHEKVCPGVEMMKQMPDIINGAASIKSW